MVTIEHLKDITGYQEDEDCITPENLRVAVEYCNKLNFHPVKQITPGFDEAWNDHPKLDALKFEDATLTHGYKHEGVQAFHEPRTVLIRAPWGGPGRGVIYVFLVDETYKP